MNLNARAWRLCQQLEARAGELGVQQCELPGGGCGWDFGNQCAGGLAAGLWLARICLSDLADVRLLPVQETYGTGWGVQVTTDHPVDACMRSQYAGWKLNHGSFFAMGSGPMRAAAGVEDLFRQLAGERAEEVVGILETGQLPPAEVIQTIAARCQVDASRVCLLMARTASQAGTVQVVARSVETTLHKLGDLKFDLSRVVSGAGWAPLPPVAGDDLAAIGRTNDAILYGAEVTLWVRGDDDSLTSVVPQVPSCSSADYGQPFATIFARYDHDFYRIDPHLFSPARVRLVNLETGHCHEAGQVDHDILRQSFRT